MNANQILAFGATKLLAPAVMGLALAALPGFAQSIYEPYSFNIIVGPAKFPDPSRLAMDSLGNLYSPAISANAIRRMTLIGTNWVVTTIAGGGVAGSADGTNGAARFNTPDGVAVDGAGNLFVADQVNSTIRKITPVGTNWVVTTIAGHPGVNGSLDGTNTAAEFWAPRSLAIDRASNLYVGDPYNNTIRKVTPVGTNWVVTTIAGRVGTSGTNDGTGSTARFGDAYGDASLNGIAVDSTGNVYVTDTYSHTIRKATPVGTNWMVTTIAGRGGIHGSADGPGSAARFNFPKDVAVEIGGNVYVTDQNNYTIRKITPVGTNWVVTTLAGMAGSGGSSGGTGSAARFHFPFGITVDKAGNLYVTDQYPNIFKGYPALVIDSAGPGFSLDGGKFSFNLTGPSGQSVVVESSADLVNWLPVWTNTITFPTNLTFTDPQSGGQSNRFYRAVTQ